ncbi:hypothetical protein DFJ74DRAFT_683162 [Hyaloraphidium curvatum]|nr:hypothetical protein DFJ74DRAFT_683162 [Hyaloraphidium curvatum]
MADVYSSLVGKTFNFEKRSGPTLAFAEGAKPGILNFRTRALLDNDPNTKSGSVAVEGSTLTLAAAGPTTLMAALPGYTTPLGKFPLNVKVVAPNKIEVTSAPVADETRSAVTLTAFEPVSELLEDIAKPNISTGGESYGERIAWVTAPGASLKEGKEVRFDTTYDKEDFDTGSATLFKFRDAGDGEKFSETVLGSAVPAGWAGGKVDPAAKTVIFVAGSSEVKFKASTEKVGIPPGWGPRELEILKLEADDKVLRILHKGLSKPVLEKYRA